jgi:hypothetical protein
VKLTFEEFVARPYKLELIEQEGAYYLIIPDLGISARGEELATTYNLLVNRKREYFEAHKALRITKNIPLPSDSRVTTDLKKFFIKSLVVVLVGVTLLSAASVSFTYALREPVRTAGLKTGRVILKEFMKGLETFANEEITKEKETKVRDLIKESIPKLKPYLTELRPLFESNENGN